MKLIIKMLLFLCFLLIRSGNSHEITNHNFQPSISFMEKPNSHEIILQELVDQQLILKAENTSKTISHDPIVIFDHDTEYHQSWSQNYLLMAFFAGLICLVFLLFKGIFLQVKNPFNKPIFQLSSIFISYQNLRI